MQGGKSTSAVGAAKEAALNVSASAWAGKEKSKAVVQEKVEKAKAHGPAAKASAEARKQERIQEVEAVKRDAMLRNAAAKERAAAANHQPTDAMDDPDAGRGLEMDGGTRPVDAPPRAGNADGRGRAAGKSDDYQLPARGGYSPEDYE